MSGCVITLPRTGRVEVVDPGDAWLAAEIDAVFAHAENLQQSPSAPVRRVGTDGLPPLSVHHTARVATTRPRHRAVTRGGRQRAPPIKGMRQLRGRRGERVYAP